MTIAYNKPYKIKENDWLNKRFYFNILQKIEISHFMQNDGQ